MWAAPTYFKVFLNDPQIKLGSTPTLFKYADDSTIVAPVWKGGSDTSSDLVEPFSTWANCNSMSCNPNECKELVIKKKGNSTFYPVVRNIPQHATLDLLGLTFQNDCKFFAHIKAKLYWEYVEKSTTARQKWVISSIVLFSLTFCLWCLRCGN